MSETLHSHPAEAAARAWLEDRGWAPVRLEPLTGDVSPRAYLRLVSSPRGPAILAVYPPAMATSYRRFLETTSLLSDALIPVPEVLERDPKLRFMLLQDLGRYSLFELGLASWDERLPYFETAVGLAGRVQGLDPQRVGPLNPRLDKAALEAELEQTWRTCLEPRGMLREGWLRSTLEELLPELCRTLGEGPLHPCHRDFMARNLLPLPTGPADLAVIDHQDLRLGPLGYDMASLLNDSLFPPASVEARLLALSGIPEEAYRRAAVQRTLKAVGTYTAFAQRGEPRHLPLIPPTLRRCLFQMERLPQLRELAGRLAEAWGSWLGHEIAT